MVPSLLEKMKQTSSDCGVPPALRRVLTPV